MSFLWRRNSRGNLLHKTRTGSSIEQRTALLDDGPLPFQSSMWGPGTSRSSSVASEEQRYVTRRIRDNPMWTLDRGTGFYQQERLSKKKASLLGSGRDTGKSKVLYYGIEWTRILRHVWKRDFFTTAVHSRFLVIVLVMVLVYISSFSVWAVIYYFIWRYIDTTCFLGFKSFISAFLFSIETQNTIGYGSHAIGDCWLPAWLVGIQCILAVLIEAVFIGIIFAKISHPKGRSRTILISECACIARRDGILKFMFRVADIRKRTAIAPKVHAVMYTWGAGHTTAEGEHVPVLVQQINLHYLDATLLLPVVVEHTVDERSPLYGHTSSSLEALGAEIVVTFEGTSELGNTFMRRQSYLPSEIHWGCTFVNIIQQAEPGSMQHSIDLSRFHDVEPLQGLSMMPPNQVSKAVVLGGSRRVPWPRLGENTLLLADELVVTQAGDGRWFLVVRLGDAYPSQMCSANVQMFFYRYSDRAERQTPASSTSSAAAAGGGGDTSVIAASYQQQTYVHQELPLTRHLWGSGSIPHPQQQQQQQQGTNAEPARSPRPSDTGSVSAADAAAAAAVAGRGGGVNVLLRYPVVVGHEIQEDSPLRDWLKPEGMMKDADAEIVVVASATQYVSSHLAMRSKVYSVLGAIRWGYSYAPCVVPPKRSPTGHAHVEWSRFHDVVPVHPSARRRTTKQHQPSGLGQQQQQQQQYSSWDRQHSLGESVNVDRGVPDAYGNQISEVVEHMTSMTNLGLSKQQQRWMEDGRQQQQQQRWQQHEVHVGLLQRQLREAEAAAEALESAWERSSVDDAAVTSATAVGGSRSSSMPLLAAGELTFGPSGQQQQYQEQQNGGQFGSFIGSLPLAHSVGFTEHHDAAQRQLQYHHTHQQQQQQQQQSQQAGTFAAQSHEPIPAQQRTDEEDSFAVMPKRADSWKDKKSLAAIWDLFEAATTIDADSAAEADASSDAATAAASSRQSRVSGDSAT